MPSTVPTSATSSSSMRVMLLSVYLPTNDDLEHYLQNAGTYARTQTTPLLLGFLAVSAPADQWQQLLEGIFHQNGSSLVDDDDNTNDDDNTKASNNNENRSTSKTLRPVKPNDDNYSRFVGMKWKPPANKKDLLSVKGNFSNNDNDTIYPRYDRCAECCTKIDIDTSSDKGDFPNTTNQQQQDPKQQRTTCSRCKFVRYCGRTCQAKHWKRVHKYSCEKTRNVTLQEAMLGHEGYYVSPDECQRIQRVLISLQQRNNNNNNGDKSLPVPPAGSIKHIKFGDDLLQCLIAYFGSVVKLGGCFVL